MHIMEFPDSTDRVEKNNPCPGSNAASAGPWPLDPGLIRNTVFIVRFFFRFARTYHRRGHRHLLFGRDGGVKVSRCRPVRLSLYIRPKHQWFLLFTPEQTSPQTTHPRLLSHIHTRWGTRSLSSAASSRT